MISNYFICFIIFGLFNASTCRSGGFKFCYYSYITMTHVPLNWQSNGSLMCQMAVSDKRVRENSKLENFILQGL